VVFFTSGFGFDGKFGLLGLGGLRFYAAGPADSWSAAAGLVGGCGSLLRHRGFVGRLGLVFGHCLGFSVKDFYGDRIGNPAVAREKFSLWSKMYREFVQFLWPCGT
jgi:hypothetical protein